MAGVGSYSTLIRAIPSTLTVGTTYWAIRNTDTTKKICITHANLAGIYVGTAGATYSVFGVCRFLAASPTGGTPLTIVKHDTVMPASAVGDARYAAGGLTTAGITFEDYFNGQVVRSQLASVTAGVSIFGAGETPFILNPGEGLAIRAFNTIISGAIIYGSLVWYELAGGA